MALPDEPRRLSRRAVVARAVGFATFALLVWDWTRSPDTQWSARAELAAIRVYRQWVSPWLGASGVRCRFELSCSRYAEQAIRSRGALVGTALAFGRVARCGPWTARGTLDPPP